MEDHDIDKNDIFAKYIIYKPKKMHALVAFETLPFPCEFFLGKQLGLLKGGKQLGLLKAGIFIVRVIDRGYQKLTHKPNLHAKKCQTDKAGLERL